MSVDHERIKWLARAGEEFFSNACNNSQLTASPPRYDENGWDFIVEFPQNKMPMIRRDAQAVPIKFFCQVKATDDFSDRTKALTVSNWEHLARNALPTFVLVIDYAGGSAPQTVHLCHIDNSRIGQSLKRIRELEAENKTEFNQHKMNLTAVETELVDFSRFDWVKTAVIQYTGYDLEAYSTSKFETLRMIGYNGNNMSMNFGTFLNTGDIVDAFLGLRKLDVVDLRVFSRRFDIDIQEDFTLEGEITIDAPPVGECYAIATSRTARIQEQYPVSLFFPGVPGLTVEQIKYKIQWPFTTMIIANKSINADIKFDPKLRLEIGSLKAAIGFLQTCRASDGSVSFYYKHGLFGSLNINDRAKPTYNFDLLYRDVKTVHEFAKFIDCKEDIEINSDEIYEGRDDIAWMRIALTSKSTRLSARFQQNLAIDLKRRTGSVYTRLVGISFDNKHLVAFCYWEATIYTQDGRVHAIVKNCRVWNCIILKDNKDELIRLHEQFQLFCKAGLKGYLLSHKLNPNFASAQAIAAVDATGLLDDAPLLKSR